MNRGCAIQLQLNNETCAVINGGETAISCDLCSTEGCNTAEYLATSYVFCLFNVILPIFVTFLLKDGF